MGSVYLIQTFGIGENPIGVRGLRALVTQGAKIHLNGDGPSLTIGRIVHDRVAFPAPPNRKSR